MGNWIKNESSAEAQIIDKRYWATVAAIKEVQDALSDLEAMKQSLYKSRELLWDRSLNGGVQDIHNIPMLLNRFIDTTSSDDQFKLLVMADINNNSRPLLKCLIYLWWRLTGLTNREISDKIHNFLQHKNDHRVITDYMVAGVVQEGMRCGGDFGGVLGEKLVEYIKSYRYVPVLEK